MSNRPKRIAELALSLALHDQLAPKLKPSRLLGQLKRIERMVMREFKRIGPVSDQERKEAGEIIARFADASRWEGKPLHIVTKVNFMLALYVTRPHCRKLIDPLQEIYWHFSKIKDAPKASEWSAALAAEKWEEIAA